MARAKGAIGFDTQTKQRLGTFPSITGDNWLCIRPEGHYRGSEKIDEHIVYVAQHEDGSMRTYTPEEFRKTFGWRNEPSSARFLALDP